MTLSPRPQLAATGVVLIDRDSDGLTDAHEQIIGTSQFMFDTDRDGFSDLEEVTRGSSPLNYHSTPSNSPLEVSIGAFGSQGFLHIVSAVYRTTGNDSNIRLRLGVLQNGVLRTVPAAYMAQRMIVEEFQVADGRVTVMDMVLHPNVVPPNSESSWVIFARDVSAANVRAADSVDVHRVGTVHMVVRPLGGMPGMSTFNSSASVYLPIPPGGNDEIPDGWTAGEICVRNGSTVGSNGAILTQEVSTAECQSGWDGFCGSECASSVGQTYTTIDPSILVGG
jgi:hypothetical protein